MPYLASNEDARNGSHGTALAIAGGVFAIAAIAGGVSNARSVKSFLSKNTDADVISSLYGRKGNGLNAIAKSYAQAVNPNVTAGHMYEVGKTVTGAPKLYKRKLNAKQVLNEAGEVVDTKYKISPSIIGDAFRNITDKDLRKVNKQIKALHMGRGDDVYKTSKLALYDALNTATQGMNITTDNLTRTVNRIYDSTANTKWRKVNVKGDASDIDITNAIWGKEKYNAK